MGTATAKKKTKAVKGTKKKKTKAEKTAEMDLRTLPKDERPKPTTGQSGKPIELSWEQMNRDEQRLIVRMRKHKGAMGIADLSEGKAFGSNNPKLRVRNALRRTVRGGWIESAGRGQYKLTQSGRKRSEGKSVLGPQHAGAKVYSLDEARKKKSVAKKTEKPKKEKKAKAEKKSTKAEKPVSKKKIKVQAEEVDQKRTPKVKKEKQAEPEMTNISRADLEEKVKALAPDLDKTSDAFKAGLILAAIVELKSTQGSKIEFVTKLAHGTVTRRMKRLKESGELTALDKFNPFESKETFARISDAMNGVEV
jgi:hypothetical protein